MTRLIEMLHKKDGPVMKYKQASINKITPPALPKVIPRKRLFRLLDQKEHYQVTWVSGIAGSGKTTLVASYLNYRNFPCLWYQMDEGDSDISTFFYYLGLAAKKASPRKRKPLPHLTPEYFPGVSVFAQPFFENLCARLSPPFFIVFDNYHKISMTSPFHDAFRDGLSRVSPDIHAMVLSRTDPPQAFASMLANNKMRIIGSNDLRLNLAESTEIVRLESKSRPAGKLIESIHKKTKGWAAGLVLIAKSVESDGSMPQTFDKFTPDEVFDYFASELFEKMDKTTRAFLLKTSLFPKMTVSMADRLTGGDDADHILSSLARNHVFTEKFLTPVPIYQYHPLFREFLISRARDVFDQEEVSQFQQQAATLLEESGQVEEAVELYFDTNDIEELIRLIKKQAKMLITQGRNKTLEQWIKKIPEDILNKNPWLLYWLGVSCQHFSSARAKDCFENAFHLFKHSQDMAGLYLSWSGIIDSIAYEWNYFTELDPWMEWIENHTRLGHTFPSQEIEAKVTVCMALALLIRRPDHPDMIQWLEKALSLSRESGNVNFYMQAIDWSMTYYAWIGNFAKVEIIREESKELAKSYRSSPAMMIHWKWIDISTRACTMEDIDSALKDVSDALVMVKETGLYVWEHIFLMPGIFISLLVGDLSTAEALLKRFESILDTSHYHGFGVFHHFAGLYNLHIGNITQARVHAETALKISDETGYVLAVIVCRFQLAYTLYELGEIQEAEEELSHTYDLAVKTKSRMFEFMCLMAKAMVALNRERKSEGLQLLQEALSLGRKNNYMTMIWWWYPAMMAQLCERALSSSIEVGYVKSLIRIHKLTPESPPYHIENWPWALKIHTFDRFQIVKDGEPIRFSGKAQKKPLELLKVLIAYGGIEVSVEQIIDALWYEADGDMAHSAFSTTLNRLRNLISIKDAIRLQAGKIALDQNYCWVDVWAFDRTLNEAEALWAKSQKEEVIALYEKAISTYKGHFLAEETEESWMIPLRERLKNRFLNAILKLGKCREEEGAFEKAIECYKNGLAADSLEEQFYQRLMLCYENLGHHAEAIKVYRLCKDTLNKVFEIGPSHKTEEIYKNILKRV